MLNLKFVILEERIVLDASIVIYVDANATGDNNGGTTGTTIAEKWANAYTDLQSALDTIDGSEEVHIWVADGTYKPSILDPRITRSDTATFLIPNLTSIYGGFLGGESSLSERDLSHQSLTILNGDILGNDPLTPPLNRNDPAYLLLKAENVNHVVTVESATVVLDGLTIKNGFAASSSVIAGREAHDSGGGIFIWSGNTTLSYVSLINNDARATVDASGRGTGGGLFVAINPLVGTPNPILTLDHVLVESNFTNRFGGGAIITSANVEISNSIVRNNEALRPGQQGQGGGIQFTAAPMVHITDSLFENNRARSPSGLSGAGGGLYAVNGSNLDIENSIVRNNISGNRAGGIGLDNGGNHLLLKNSLIEGNTARLGGGGIESFFATDHMIIQDCIIRNNTAIDTIAGGVTFGGGILIGARFGGVNNILIERTLFENNNAVNGQGGGINIQTNGIVTINDSTFRGNSSIAGGAITNLSQVTITGSLFENNSATSANGRGGAILNGQASTAGVLSNSLTLSNSRFYNNSSSLDGGGVYSGIGTILNVSNTEFHNNNAVRDGGGLYILGGSLTVSGVTTVRTTSISVVNGHFNHNFAGRDGGNLAAVGWTSATSLGIVQLTVTDSHFLNSDSGRNGGSVALNNLNLTSSLATFQYNHFNHNEALNNGGGIASFNSNLLLLKNKFANNDAEVLGDDVYISAGSAEVNGETDLSAIAQILELNNHFGNLDPNDIVVNS